ncbi:MAG: DUF4346 domain-containing protein [DPANN group archaeon]|nr:DUF4346 domain-containing protein [DPANN group archaeon]
MNPLNTPIKTIDAKTHNKYNLVLDTKSFFVIKLDNENKKIQITYYKPIIENNGKIIKGTPQFIISGENGRDLYRDIIDQNLISQKDHAAYLGYEIARVENALKNNTKYIQDN